MNENNIRTNITITPQGSISICKTQLENDYKNQLTFSNLEAQLTYFQTKVQQTFSDYTYIKKDNTINVGINIDEIINCNYLFYTNTGFTTKTYYCFITNMQYVNENCTKITFETDCFQTYQFDIQYVNTFIEREHVTNDTIGAHTIPEKLELGEYIVEDTYTPPKINSHLIIAATYDCFTNKDAGSFINGIYSGVDYFLIGQINPYLNYSDSSAIKYFLEVYAYKTKIDSITGMFIVPDDLTNYSNITNWDYMFNSGGTSQYPYKKLSDSLNEVDLTAYSISKPYSSIDSYVPHNNKLYTYPYKYLKVSNNTGSSAIYQYEYFTNNPFTFSTKGAITPGCSIRTFPVNYKNVLANYDEGITRGKYPVCSYNVDMYTNWLTQNGINIGLNLASGTGQIVTGLAIAGGTGGLGGVVGGGSIVGGVSTIANTLTQVYEHSLIPPQAEGNLNSGDINFSMDINKTIFYKMSIKREFAKIIDSYFDMFGYKVNIVKTPNIHTRSKWNFIKTIDCNLEGDIPQTDLNILKTMFNNGVTFWHDPTKMYDYTQTNSILT